MHLPNVWTYQDIGPRPLDCLADDTEICVLHLLLVISICQYNNYNDVSTVIVFIAAVKASMSSPVKKANHAVVDFRVARSIQVILLRNFVPVNLKPFGVSTVASGCERSKLT